MREVAYRGLALLQPVLHLVQMDAALLQATLHCVQLLQKLVVGRLLQHAAGLICSKEFASRVGGAPP